MILSKNSLHFVRGGHIIHQEFPVTDGNASPGDLKRRCLCRRRGGVHIAEIPGVYAGTYQMHRRGKHIDKGDGDPVVLEPGEEKNAKGDLVGLGEYSVIGSLFVDLDLINNESL